MPVTPVPVPVVVPVVVTPTPPPVAVPPPAPIAAAAGDPPVTTDPVVPPPAPPVVVIPVVATPVETPAAVVTDPTPVNDYTSSELAQEEDSTRFIFNLQAAYQIRVRTALRLSASRSTDGSATLGASSVERTTVSLGLDQGIGRRFAVGLESGYEKADYGDPGVIRTVSDTGAVEENSLSPTAVYWYGRASLNYMPRPNTSIGVFYEFRSNDGGGGSQSYEANRIGLQAAISF